VSWSQWRGGRNEEAACATPLAGLYPSGSATWVDPLKVRLGLPFEGSGVLQEGPEGCLYLATYEGGVYHLMVDQEFREKWWVALPGAFFNVRGLLSAGAPDPAGDLVCPPLDGNVYHPLLIPPSWDTGVHSWDRGPFHSGERVVLVGESNPYGAANLPRGATGTIICRNSLAERSILVSWDLWSNGDDVNAYRGCTDRYSGLFAPRSTWWVAPLDIAKYYESDCGVLEQTQLCCGQQCAGGGMIGLFVQFQDVLCLPDITVDGPLPTGLYRATGLYTPYEELMGSQAATSTNSALSVIGGVVFDSLVTACHVPNCCVPAYLPGDRVKLLVNEPGGAQGIFVGHGGTVMCCNPYDPITPILVSWDNWTGGNDDDELCESKPDWYRDNSAWWMACTEIKRVVLPDLYDREEARLFLPDTLAVGKHLKISGEIANGGGADSGPFVVNIYLSQDAKISSDDYRIGQLSFNIDAGGSIGLSWLNPLPAAITPGTYYVGWVIDPDNRVAEEDETNNTTLLAGQLTVTNN
jgi:hypothetical protein